MNAVIAGHDSVEGYLFKCPVCGTILKDRPWTCPNCQSLLSSYRTDLFSEVESPKVMIDLLGVVLDMLGALGPYLKEKAGVVLDPARVTDYDFDCDLGFDRQLIFSAFKDHELHKSIGTYEKVEDALRLLQTRCHPKAYTGVVDKPEIVSITNAVIRNLGLSGSALTYKKPTIYDAHVLFDDCVAVHRQFQRDGFGGLQYLIDRPYNQQKAYDPVWDKVIRVSSLYDGVVDMFRRFGWPVPEVCSDA